MYHCLTSKKFFVANNQSKDTTQIQIDFFNIQFINIIHIYSSLKALFRQPGICTLDVVLNISSRTT